MLIDAINMDFRSLGEAVRSTDGDLELKNVQGQRFIAAGRSEGNVDIYGVAGNACGAYLNGCTVTVHGNGQDAVGDTMNDGAIIIHGSVGDAPGYAMRGGEIYVKGDAGYRCGIHMKAYKDKCPVMVIGGKAGSFLGEYQAGGVIVVLGIGSDRSVGNFCGTGMHGGKIFLRGASAPPRLPAQVAAAPVEKEDRDELLGYIRRYCELFDADYDSLSADDYIVLKPNSANPYKKMYVQN
jgi:glutamate synthase domain-containing protein 3